VKGLEFEDVIICGLEDGIMPTSRAKDSEKDLEEERRLMYVAVTRAKKRLWLTRSKSRYLYGHRETTIPSRFILDLHDKVAGDTNFRNPRASSYGSGNSYGNSYGNKYGNSYGYKRSGYTSDGYEGDFWDSSSKGRGLYSSDEGYVPDPPAYDAPKTSGSSVKHFSAASTFGAAKASAPVGQKSYAVGCKVRHPKFGVGTVIALKNGGSVIDIAFEGQGVKELSAALAPLEKL
ncbi:MAG: ATP-binding domain-containing protein, partial [Clostridia bacterium]|nr:ATP-binding domain-containing protein [Clostridia bacterium]